MRSVIVDRFHYGKQTQTAGTPIVVVVPPQSGRKTLLNKLSYTNSTTAHLLNILRSQGSTTASAAAAASQADIALTAISLAKDFNGVSLSENLAANDWLVIQHSDGSWGAYKISSISSLTVTLTSNLSKAVSAGAQVYGMYEISRTLGIPALTFDLAASATTVLPGSHDSPEVGFAQSNGVNEPLLVYSDNATAAGTLNFLAATYLRT